MIRVFGQTDKSFITNGDAVVRPLKAKVHKEDNGDYYLDLQTGLEYLDYLVGGNIVIAPTPQGDQAFRVGNVTKTKGKLSTRAYHVFYDSKNYLIADSYVVNKTCDGALDHLNSATEPESPFSTYSDIRIIDSYRCVRKSLYEAIKEVVSRWGGHLVRDNFNIYVMSSIGHDNGVTVQYRKNLKDITCSENWDSVITKILPVGKDGILLNEIDPSADIYITSQTQYAIPFTKTVSFNQDSINSGDFETEEEYKQALVDDLRAQATVYLEQNALPKVNYKLKANLDYITDIGDTVEVIDERLGVDIMTSVIGFEYDCILGKYTEVEFGNFTNTISGLVGNLTSSIDKTTDVKINDAVSSINFQIAEQVSNPAKKIYSVGEYVMYQNNFCKVTHTISEGDIFAIGGNLAITSVSAELIEAFDDIDEMAGDITDLSGEIEQRPTFLQVYPVGSIYTSTSSTDPHDLFGGTWTQKSTSPYYTWERTT